MLPRFSIVIPALNARLSLELVLRCLEAQEYPVNQFECIVIDDGSTDDTANFMQNYRGSLSLVCISHGTTQGRAKARNTGWRRAQGEILIFLDADTLPDPKWLADYAKAFDSEYDVVSGNRYCVDSSPTANDFQNRLCLLLEVEPQDLFRTNVKDQFLKLHRQSKLGPYSSPLFETLERELRHLCLQSPQSVLCAYSFMTSNVAVRRHLVEKVTGFDPFLRRGEDTDLGIRIWELGARFGFAEGATAYHQYDPAQSDRNLTYGEYLSFFYRNPYKLVLLLYFWLREYESLKGIGPLVSDLSQLVWKSDHESGVDLVEQYCRRYKFAVPVDCQYTKEELVRSYHVTTGILESAISLYLDRAVAGGLYVRRVAGRVLFDFHVTSNWLRYRTTFQEEWIKATSYSRRSKTRYLLTQNQGTYSICEYRGTYEIHLNGDDRRPGRIEALANIPLPAHGNVQFDVKIVNCRPPDLLDYADSRQEMISRYVLPATLDELGVGYDFVCKVKEITSPVRGADADKLSNYLSLTWPAKWHAKLRSILDKLSSAGQNSDFLRARAIYLWILDNTFYSSTPFPDSNILDMGCGPCVDQSRLFVNLCRLAGIPARECCGALLQRQTAGSGGCTFETVTFASSPFAHSWAECHIADQGWMPVEFIGQSYGRRILRPLNVNDPNLRSELAQDTAIYDGYYFGALDPYRIHATPEASMKSTYPIVAKEQQMAGNNRRLLASLRHRLTCELVRYSEYDWRNCAHSA